MLTFKKICFSILQEDPGTDDVYPFQILNVFKVGYRELLHCTHEVIT